MRNGNLLSNFFHCKVDKVLTVPMRNGNLQNDRYLSFVHIVLTVPMRNGNIDNESNFYNSLPCSYRTYEEWKLPQKESKSNWELLGSYRTYEEWKRCVSFSLANSIVEFLPYL